MSPGLTLIVRVSRAGVRLCHEADAARAQAQVGL